MTDGPQIRTHRAPTTCPVCSTSLITLRLGCPQCATELSGHFDSCRYCRLDTADLATLEVFLRSRGNIRDVQAHLGVSYPTARLRLTEVLDRLGLSDSAPPEVGHVQTQPTAAGPDPAPSPTPDAAGTASAAQPAPPGPPTGAILRALADGTLSVAQAERLLGHPAD